MNYYNEIDPFAASWLRNLITAGHIPAGEVDERSIEDVKPVDLVGFTQHHFFAGIGGWSQALKLASWPEDKPVCTGSCPCQPFSTAGKGGGFTDERHLWPAFFHLIQYGIPGVPIFGEQVASSDGLAWLDLVQADCEGANYSFRAEDRCGASVGAPHIRQRLYWMAYASEQRREPRGWAGSEGSGRDAARQQPGRLCDASRLAYTTGERQRANELEGDRREGQLLVRARSGSDSGDHGPVSGPGATNGFWRDADWLRCTDDKWRPVEPGAFPLAHGVPGRVGRLRAYGNAIIPQVAASFVRGCMP